MSLLDDLKPKKRFLVMNLLEEAGVNISAWANTKGRPAANPKYCYNWSFEEPGEFVVVCLWHSDLKNRKSTVIRERKRREFHFGHGSNSQMWLKRAQAFDSCLEAAYRQELPVRVIVVDGDRRESPEDGSSAVRARLLDGVPWAVTEYDAETGGMLLVRGASPVVPAGPAAADRELLGFEGRMRRSFILHRQREGRARRAKIKDALSKSGGRLICEVKNCGFDFKERYGALGEGYAHVHHLNPLSASPSGGREVKLSDLAIVCANCHAMIHVGGGCRPIDSLIH